VTPQERAVRVATQVTLAYAIRVMSPTGRNMDARWTIMEKSLCGAEPRLHGVESAWRIVLAEPRPETWEEEP
jgi:hypothetical protein